MLKNEQGLSLVEVLATITILSIVGVLLWQVFFQGYQYSNKAASKNMLQQEANLVVTNLTKIHQSHEGYSINSSNGKIEVFDSSNNSIAVFTNSQYYYEIFSEGTKIEIKSVIPVDHDLTIEIKLSEKDNLSNFIRVEALLYRLKDGEIDV